MKSLVLFLAVGCVSSVSLAASYCGPLKNPFGPFDYRKAASQYPYEKELVESTHFTSDVQDLIKGNAGYLAGDLDYTLRAFPNHHPALVSMARLALRTKGTKDRGMKWSFTCYFERAERYAPDDDAVFMIYGTYLMKRNDIPGAKAQLERALALNDKNTAANYNLGLINLNQGNYDKAVTYAKKAYADNYPAQALKERLIEAGKWDRK